MNCLPMPASRRGIEMSEQVAGQKPQQINLDDFGVDAQAVNCLPRDTAVRYHVIPVRVLGDELVIAVDEAAYPQVAKELVSILGSKLIFVLSKHGPIARAIRSYYPPQSNAA